MKAAILREKGAPPVYGDWREPEINTGETLVEVTAASIKQLDKGIAAGTHYSSPKSFPVIAGVDGVGRTATGERVYFMVKRRPFGAFAERAPGVDCVAVPDGLDDAVAAAIVNPALAAWLPLVWRAQMQKGESVLILGATSASGRLAVKAARRLGAGRIVVAGRRREALESLGADAIIDLTAPPEALRAALRDEAARGLSVVVDYVWGPPAEALISVFTHADLDATVAERDVRYVQVGAMAGATIALNGGALRGARLTLMGSGTGNWPSGPKLREVIAEVFALAARGEITQAVERRPLCEVGAAWREPASPDYKLVLTM